MIPAIRNLRLKYTVSFAFFAAYIGLCMAFSKRQELGFYAEMNLFFGLMHLSTCQFRWGTVLFDAYSMGIFPQNPVRKFHILFLQSLTGINLWIFLISLISFSASNMAINNKLETLTNYLIYCLIYTNFCTLEVLSNYFRRRYTYAITILDSFSTLFFAVFFVTMLADNGMNIPSFDFNSTLLIIILITSLLLLYFGSRFLYSYYSKKTLLLRISHMPRKIL